MQAAILLILIWPAHKRYATYRILQCIKGQMDVNLSWFWTTPS